MALGLVNANLLCLLLLGMLGGAVSNQLHFAWVTNSWRRKRLRS